MRRVRHDGPGAILYEPHQLIERLAALMPKPRINLLLCHGVFGSELANISNRRSEPALVVPPVMQLVYARRSSMLDDFEIFLLRPWFKFI
jgi:hypothetical protein